jgi:hypothetical protein
VSGQPGDPNYINPRLAGFADPQYQRDAAGYNAALADFSAAYHTRVAELAAQAIKAGTPLAELPPELAALVAQARDLSEGVNPSDVPEAVRPFVVLGKILLAVLSAI